MTATFALVMPGAVYDEFLNEDTSFVNARWSGWSFVELPPPAAEIRAGRGRTVVIVIEPLKAVEVASFLDDVSKTWLALGRDLPQIERNNAHKARRLAFRILEAVINEQPGVRGE